MKVSYRQISILIFMSFVALKFLALPSLLYLDCENMSWLVEVVLMIVDAIYAFLLIELIRRNGNKNVYEFMKETLGLTLTKIFLLVLIIKYFFVVANIAKGLEFFVVDNLYTNFSMPLFVLPLAAVTGFIIYKGAKNIGRLSEIFVWVIVAMCGYVALKSLKSVDIMEFLPMFKVEGSLLVKSGFKYIGWFGSSTFLIMFFGIVDFSNRKKFQLFGFILLAIFLVQLIYFIFYGSFGVTSSLQSFGISDIGQNYSTNSTLSRLSWLLVSIWIIAQVVQISLFAFCLISAIRYFLGTKTDAIPIFIYEICLLIWGFLGQKIIQLEVVFFSPFCSYVTIFASYVLPLILWCGYLVQKRKKVKYEKVAHSV